MKAFVFPGQAAQFEGMGLDMFESSAFARDLFLQADEILGFSLTDVMFRGSADDLKQTKVTQPAVFVHSVVKAKLAGEAFCPDAVAGHSLGEFSALVAAGAMSYADGLALVAKRAFAMQAACEQTPGTMAAVLGLEDEVIEAICAGIGAVVVPANYNCPSTGHLRLGRRGRNCRSGARSSRGNQSRSPAGRRRFSLPADEAGRRRSGFCYRKYRNRDSGMPHLSERQCPSANRPGRDPGASDPPAHRSGALDANHAEYVAGWRPGNHRGWGHGKGASGLFQKN